MNCGNDNNNKWQGIIERHDNYHYISHCYFVNICYKICSKQIWGIIICCCDSFLGQNCKKKAYPENFRVAR